MPRRALIRSRTWQGKGSDPGTAVAQVEELIAQNFKTIVNSHQVVLEKYAGWVERAAYSVVPLKTGRLRRSISVRVSKSYRYPGIIAHASAFHKGVDYAPIQEQREDFNHNIVVKKPLVYGGEPVEQDVVTGRIAHYLGGPFTVACVGILKSAGVKNIQLPGEFMHAYKYFKEFGGKAVKDDLARTKAMREQEKVITGED